MGPNLRRISGRPFSNQEVHLDGHEYTDCTFQSCLLVYMGKRKFRLIGNMVSADCRFEFRGKAAETVETLYELYALGDWGKQSVRDTLRRIVPDIEKSF
jgi:hypothetical protein